VLRDSASITRQAYLEFDLEAMLDGEVYADFVLLWLIGHQSRLEGKRPSDCWLEKWSQAAQQQGTRALDQLRDGVQLTIEALGRGFLAHPSNGDLRASLQSGALDGQEYYRQVLRLVYRLLFLFVAEDRDLLLHPDADPAARGRYSRFYGLDRLRRLAERRVGTRHADLYQMLRLVLDQLGQPDGCPALGLPSLGSFLFSPEAVGALGTAELSNQALLDAVRALAFFDDRAGRRQVDYRNLGSEEIGSVYESLLELHPELHVDAAAFTLKTAAGNERKTTGSYYTPTSLITCLLDSALDPVLAEAASQADPERAILALKIVDPACGSGHFLIAAAHRLAKRLAAIRTGDDEPSPAATRQALRDVIGRCVYGVDINPMSVELCKVALWMEALEPGKPLSFLDHHIQCGNALLGATPTLLAKGIPDEAFAPIEGDDRAYCADYRRRNRQQRAGQREAFTDSTAPWERLGSLAAGLAALDGIDDDTLDGVRRKQERYAELVGSTEYQFGRLLADLWCAAFVWKKNRSFDYPITEQVFRGAERSPFRLASWQRAEVERLAEQYRFFHWHLAFPDVFGSDGRGGFDLVLGNPPWEKVELAEKEWFASRRPDIANARNGAARKRMIDDLAEKDPALHAAFIDNVRQVDGERHVLRDSGRFPLCGLGKINPYAIFAELNRALLGPTGRVGCIVPSRIATDDTTKLFFQDLMEQRALVSLFSFFEVRRIFLDTDSRSAFCLLTLTGIKRPTTEGAEFAFDLRSTTDLLNPSRRFVLTAEDLALLNPNTRTCPVFRSRRDADLTRAVYRRVPVLVDECRGVNPWGVEFKQGLFNMTSDSGLFESAPGFGFVPLYEAKLFHQFEHRLGTYAGRAANSQDSELPRSTPDQLADPEYAVTPRYWVGRTEIAARLRDRWDRSWRLAFRDIARSTDERTVIFAVLPRVGVGHKAPLLQPACGAHQGVLLFANLNSLVLDFAARQKIGGTNLAFFVAKQLPLLNPHDYVDRDIAFIRDHVIELTYTAWDLQPFAHDLDYEGPPFRWDEERRFLLRCELDALYFHLYGIERDDVDYIMETFPIVKRKDGQRYGEYRTKRVILEIYDELAEAQRGGQPYQTRLDPPPADPRVAHPDREHPRELVAASAPTTTQPTNPMRASNPGRPMNGPTTARPTATNPSRPPAGTATGRAVRRRPARSTGRQSALPGILSSAPTPRQKVLDICLGTLRGAGPLTAAELAARLAFLVDGADEQTIASVLATEGTRLVRRDAGGRYAPR
jgi:hypothetical protein